MWILNLRVSRGCLYREDVQRVPHGQMYRCLGVQAHRGWSVLSHSTNLWPLPSSRSSHVQCSWSLNWTPGWLRFSDKQFPKLWEKTWQDWLKYDQRHQGTLGQGEFWKCFLIWVTKWSVHTKQAYLIRYEMYCCLPLRKPKDPASVFLIPLSAMTADQIQNCWAFQRSWRSQGRGKLGWHLWGQAPFRPQQSHGQKLLLLFSSSPCSPEI